MYYGEEFVEEVRQRNDIVDVISSYVNLKKSGSNFTGLCPFHNEKTPSFSVSGGKQMYYCFGCGAGGNVFTFLMEYENLTFPEALEQLAERAGMALPEKRNSREERERRNARERILEIYKLAANYFYAKLNSERGQEAKTYLLGRQLSEETIRRFGLGYSDKYSNDLYQYMKKKGFDDTILNQTGLFTFHEKQGVNDKFWNRVMFPIMDRSGKVIAFGGRVMGDAKPKYLNSPETLVFDKSRNLYGLNFVHGKLEKGIIICEGYMDVIALHQAGFDNAVASLGTALTSGHANLLKRYTKDVYLTYDSDGAGIKAALRAIPILKEVGITTKVINMKPYKDPDEFIKALGAEAYQERIDQAENSFLFEVRILEQEYEMHDPESKTSFYNEVAKKLCGFSEKLARDNYIEAVAAKYMIAAEDLRRLVNQYGLKEGLAGVASANSDRQQSGIRGNEKNKGRKKEDGMKQSQKLLLTWLIENTGLFQKIKKYITPADFTEEIYHRVAELLFAQYEESGTVNPAKIVSMFENEEEQSEIAGLFNATIPAAMTKEDRDKALKETIVRIKENSINHRSKELGPTDMEGLMKLVQDKKALEELERMHISM